MFEQIAKTIIEVSLLSVAAILLVMILRAIFGAKLKTRLLGVLWMVVLLRLVLPVTLNSPVHLGDVFNFGTPPVGHTAVQEGEATSPYTAFSPNGATAANADLADKTNAEAAAENPDAEITAQKPISINPWHFVLGVWLMGMLGFLGVNGYRMIAFKQKAANGKVLDTPVIHRLVGSNQAKLGVSNNIRVIECQYISVPVVMGLKHPMILLPEGLADAIDECRLDKVILHEMCHIKRKDLLKSFLWLAARAIHWFNPLIWFAYKAYLDDVESACDETAMRYLSRDGVYEYSEALVEVIKRAQLHGCAPVLVSFCKDKSKLRKRVMNMINPQRKSKSVSIIAVLLMLTIVLGCFTTACTSTDPQEASAEAIPDIAVQPADTPVVEASSDETPSDQADAIPEAGATSLQDDALEAVVRYAVNDNETFEYYDSEDFYGDKILTIMGKDGMTMYKLFASDLSLKSLSTKTCNVNLPMDISEEEAKTIIINYAKKFWPGMQPEIIEYEFRESEDVFRTFSVEGVLKNSTDQSKQQFFATVNGTGELVAIGRIPNPDVDQSITEGTAITLEQAREHAYEYLNENIDIVNMDNLKIVSEKLNDTGETDPQYIFEFEYRSAHPTPSNFDYNVTVAIIPSSGAFAWSSVTPILDNIDLIPIEEAEQIAKECISKKYNKNIEDLKTTQTITDCHSNMICYLFFFNNDYSVTVAAETGEIRDYRH